MLMQDMNRDKVNNGVFYTIGNPFANTAFRRWAKAAGLPEQTILEPFAGANHLIKRLRDMRLCNEAHSFDISPGANDVAELDTLTAFPQGYDVCITNPPWLAKNRATRLGLTFPDTAHDDLYKLSLEKCIDHCGWVAAVIPESFIRCNLFQARLADFVSLTEPMFEDTDHPVGLALFEPNTTSDVRVWRNDKEIGTLSKIKKKRPSRSQQIKVEFNKPDGNVGLIAIDNTIEASIRFCEPSEIGDYDVKYSCRSITKIRVDGKVAIDSWNKWIKQFRHNTADVLLTSFKGRRKDGKYRRRLDFDLARGIINNV